MAKKVKIENIKYIEVDIDKIYIEFGEMDSTYVSYTKARNLIKESPVELIEYVLTADQKANDFVNTMPKRTQYDDGKGRRYLKKRTDYVRKL